MKRSRNGTLLIERLLESSYLQQTSRSPELGDCFIWGKNVNPAGYGTIVATIGEKKRPWLVHRVAWMEINGLIPPKFHVCHLCDNPPCWRPDHLFLGTDLDNALDKVKKNRWHLTPYTPISHCSNGHELTAENAEFFPVKGRMERRCRICHNANTRNYYARKKLKAQQKLLLVSDQACHTRT